MWKLALAHDHLQIHRMPRRPQKLLIFQVYWKHEGYVLLYHVFYENKRVATEINTEHIKKQAVHK